MAKNKAVGAGLSEENEGQDAGAEAVLVLKVPKCKA
jgi:hypothetical protein